MAPYTNSPNISHIKTTASVLAISSILEALTSYKYNSDEKPRQRVEYKNFNLFAYSRSVAFFSHNISILYMSLYLLSITWLKFLSLFNTSELWGPRRETAH